jgi:AraC-like DNA-binding protein
MSVISFSILPPPEGLENEVECFRIAKYAGEEALVIRVCPNGLPGIVFQHNNHGQPVIKKIITDSPRIDYAPTLFMYGLVTKLSVMHFEPGPYTTIQVLLKPNSLNTLLGINVSALNNRYMQPREFGAEGLNVQLIGAHDDQERIALLSHFLLTRRGKDKTRDELIDTSLGLVRKNIGSINVEYLLETLHISERQFERRFRQAVGVSPQFYIRLIRFNEAMRLMDTGQYERLTDIAHALNFHDQSHFIRDIKVFSGITPKAFLKRSTTFIAIALGPPIFICDGFLQLFLPLR